MSLTEATPKQGTKAVPIDERLHKLLKQRALDEDKTLREVAESLLGPPLGWRPEDKAQLKLQGMA